jgi:hypothetical protein
MLQLAEYIRELIGLIKGGQSDPEFGASVASLDELAQRLRTHNGIEQAGR